MDADTGADGETEPVADPSDLIVGTIRPPAWLGRIPTPAWLFVALAAVDVAYRIWPEFRSGPDGISPTSVVSVLLSVVIGAATVLLPAAMLVGRRGLGRAESWLLQGGIALAAAELLGVFGRDVVNAVADSPSFDSGVSDFMVQSLVVQALVLLLRIFGLAKIGLGFDVVATPARPLGRVVVAVLAATLAAWLLGDVLSIQSLQAGSDTLLATYNLLILGTGIVVIVMWAWIASIAARRTGPPWGWIAAGALAVVLGAGTQATGYLVAIQRAGTDDALTILIWFGLVASALAALGTALLVVGFTRGFEPVDEAGGSEAALDDAPDADPLARPAGA